VIVARPQDAVVSEHSVVRLQCRATGDPEPVIVWTKRDGQIPAERSETIRSLGRPYFTIKFCVVFLVVPVLQIVRVSLSLQKLDGKSHKVV